jgi:hypothetical protein
MLFKLCDRYAFAEQNCLGGAPTLHLFLMICFGLCIFFFFVLVGSTFCYLCVKFVEEMKIQFHHGLHSVCNENLSWTIL